MVRSSVRLFLMNIDNIYENDHPRLSIHVRSCSVCSQRASKASLGRCVGLNDTEVEGGGYRVEAAFIVNISSCGEEK